MREIIPVSKDKNKPPDTGESSRCIMSRSKNTDGRDHGRFLDHIVHVVMHNAFLMSSDHLLPYQDLPSPLPPSIKKAKLPFTSSPPSSVCMPLLSFLCAKFNDHKTESKLCHVLVLSSACIYTCITTYECNINTCAHLQPSSRPACEAGATSGRSLKKTSMSSQGFSPL